MTIIPHNTMTDQHGNWSPDEIAPGFDIAPTLANEVVYVNDDWRDSNKTEDRQSRWRHVRAWAVRNLITNEVTP